MALATHQLQSCFYSSFPSVPSSWSRGCKLKRSVPSSFPVGRKDRLISLKCRSCLSVGGSLALGPKSKFFKISAFKGNSRHDGSGSRNNGLKSLKNPAKVSYWQHESKESLVESSKVQNVVPASYSAADETTTRSQAIQNLFKNWLILLRLPSQTQPVEVVDEPSSTSTTELPNTKQKRERGEVLKAVWCYFMGLDATIKIPLLIFAPLYLTVNLICGSEVSKELTPLWFLGPIIVALYIKMFRAICGLYAFIFKQTVKILKT
ncbi:uncharacterized protein [Henckelia pumila]|uniref:uncharacterized protein isoform X2 n=1 Tax=Henckelia pumila TaxID=405737 RepID=UPI003C6E5D38